MTFNRRQRAFIAFGGFVLFIGFAMLTLAILGAPGIEVIEFDVFSQHFELMIGISVVVGVLDIIVGLLLSFSSEGGD